MTLYSKVDRSKVSSKCSPDSQDFRDKYGIASTQANCNFVGLHFVHPNCSVAMFSGLPAPGDVTREFLS